MTDIISIPTQFATGDGTTQTFPVAAGTNISVSSVSLVDWQGTTPLSTTPRTNGFKYSNQFAQTSGWLRTRIGSIVDNAITGPDGGGASLITADASASAAFYIYQSIAVTAGVAYPVVVYAKPVPGQTTQNNVHDFASNANVKFNLSGAGSITSKSGPVASCSITLMPSGFYRLEAWFVPAATGNTNVSPIYLVTNSSMYLANAQIGTNGAYIPTQGTPVTLTDYTVAPNGDVVLGAPLAIGATLTWTGQYDPILPEFDARDTVISQYANSPTLLQMVDSMQTYFDPSMDFKRFYDTVWNINTATGFGLDVWGKIVNVSRTLTIPGVVTTFGFSEQGSTAQPFGQAPFYNGVATTQNYVLTDSAYRTLILTKALSNISNGSAPSINAALRGLFAGRGRCYAVDLGGMSMMYTFEFALQPFEVAILTQAKVIPRPAGVTARVMQMDAASTFGFAEQGTTAQPFNQGTFFNPDVGIIAVT